MIWFKKKDPICGMKEEKNKGVLKHGYWFCSESCLKEYDGGIKSKRTGSCH